MRPTGHLAPVALGKIGTPEGAWPGGTKGLRTPRWNESGGPTDAVPWPQVPERQAVKTLIMRHAVDLIPRRGGAAKGGMKGSTSPPHSVLGHPLRIPAFSPNLGPVPPTPHP